MNTPLHFALVAVTALGLVLGYLLGGLGHVLLLLALGGLVVRLLTRGSVL